jgi:hypothetical protein
MSEVYSAVGIIVVEWCEVIRNDVLTDKEN